VTCIKVKSGISDLRLSVWNCAWPSRGTWRPTYNIFCATRVYALIFNRFTINCSVYLIATYVSNNGTELCYVNLSIPTIAQYYVDFFKFVWPCIVTNFFIIKPTRCTNFTNLFWHETLHVSDSSSVHHQGFIYCTLSNGVCHKGL